MPFVFLFFIRHIGTRDRREYYYTRRSAARGSEGPTRNRRLFISAEAAGAAEPLASLLVASATNVIVSNISLNIRYTLGHKRANNKNKLETIAINLVLFVLRPERVLK